MPAGIVLWSACLFIKSKTGMKVTCSVLVSPLFQQGGYIILVLQKTENKIQVTVPSFTCLRHSETVARINI